MRPTKDAPIPFRPSFASREAWEARAASLRRQAAIALGVSRPLESLPIHASIHGRIECDAYTVEKVFFRSLPGLYVTGNLYRPRHRREERVPAVLHPYGHWPDGRFIWQDDAKIDKAISSGAERLRCSARSPLQACNVTLARMGCVVFHYDMVGYCDSTALEHGRGFDDAEALLRSQNMAGLQTTSSIRALDFVTSLPEVDAARIAVGGASSGGTQTLLLGLMDERPAAFFIAGMISMNMQGGCPCENAPLLRLDTNNVELCATLAPRHVFCSGATGDWTHDFDRRGLPELKHIYGLYDARDRVDGNVLPWPHNFNAHTRADFYAFVDRALGLNSGPEISEREFVPMSPAQLSVFSAEHPRPSDEADIDSLRATWRPTVGVKEWLDAWIGPVEPSPVAPVSSVRVRLVLRNLSRAAGTCLIEADADTHSIELAPLEPMTILRDKPAWFDFVFNRPVLVERARQVLAIALGIRAQHGGPLVLEADDASSIIACVACAARPGLFESASVKLGGFRFDQIGALDDERLLPSALACGGIDAILRAARPTVFLQR